MSTSRPWWASDGPVGGGIDRTEDPLDVHRAARRGPEPDPGPDRGGHPPGSDHHEGSTSGPTQPGSTSGPTQPGSTSGPTDPGSTSGPTQPGHEICGVCPICIAARIVGETRPELVAHLAEAGRHLAAAMRTLLEPGADPPEGDARGRTPDEVRRIDLD